MEGMRFLANENIPRASISRIRSEGYDIKAVGTDHAGVSDREVIQLSLAENRIILTLDKDYGELIYKHGFRPLPGVIYFRLKEISPESPGKMLTGLLKESRLIFAGKFTVIDTNGIRQRGI